MPDQKTDQAVERAVEAFGAIDAKSQAFIAEAWAQMDEGKSMRPGGGGRFAALKKALGARKGKGKVSDPGALASFIGRKKFGVARFTKMGAAGRKRAARKGR